MMTVTDRCLLIDKGSVAALAIFPKALMLVGKDKEKQDYLLKGCKLRRYKKNSILERERGVDVPQAFLERGLHWIVKLHGCSPAARGRIYPILVILVISMEIYGKICRRRSEKVAGQMLICCNPMHTLADSNLHEGPDSGQVSGQNSKQRAVIRSPFRSHPFSKNPGIYATPVRYRCNYNWSALLGRAGIHCYQKTLAYDSYREDCRSAPIGEAITLRRWTAEDPDRGLDSI